MARGFTDLQPVVESGAGGESLENGVDKTKVAGVGQTLHIKPADEVFSKVHIF